MAFPLGAFGLLNVNPMELVLNPKLIFKKKNSPKINGINRQLKGKAFNPLNYLTKKELESFLKLIGKLNSPLP